MLFCNLLLSQILIFTFQIVRRLQYILFLHYILVLHCYFYTISYILYNKIVMYNLADRTTAVDVIARRDAGVR